MIAACGGSSTQKSTVSPSKSTAGAESPAPRPPTGDLEAILASEHRSNGHRARDRYRHPAQTLAFFGVEPDMELLEVRPGGGWYAEILAPYLSESGKLIVAIPSADGPRGRYHDRFMAMKKARPEVFEKVETVTFDPPAPIDLGPSESVDMVLTFRNTHNWINDGGEKEAYAAFFDVLKPGGVLGVVQHRADDASDAKQTAKSGYVPESYVVATAEAAGFELVERSDINRNEKDTHDHPGGVWTLPPAMRLGEQNKAEYLEIGESDRMTLKFRKPEPAE